MKTEIPFTAMIGTNIVPCDDEHIIEALMEMEVRFNTDHPEFRLHLLKIGKAKHEKKKRIRKQQ